MKVKPNNQSIFFFYITFLMAVTISCNSQSQSNKENQIVHSKIDSTRLKSNKEVPSILENSKEKNWFGSYNKINKIDSTKLKYTTGVISILEDSKGNIWFGSNSEGVCLLQNGKFQYFTTQNGLSDNGVRSIYEDKNGIIWFACGLGLSSYDGREMAIFRESDYKVKNERKFNDSDLWFKSDKIEGYNKSTKFVRSKNGTIWFGADNKLIGFKGKHFKIFNNDSVGLNGTTEFLHIRSLMEDSKGNLWIGNNSGGGGNQIGVIKYDGKDFIQFTKQLKLRAEDTKGNSLDRVFSIGEDTLGNIWFGTVESGVWRYDGLTMKNFTKKDGLDSDMTWVIHKSKTGELWFGGGANGVYLFNGKCFERKY